MSNRFLEYLERERARLDSLIAALGDDALDKCEYTRLQRQRRVVEDQLAQWRADTTLAAAA